jgi:YegS/Rv2252/BmrU family lipid kinase
MNIHVIVNPRAAYGQAARKWPHIRKTMERSGLTVHEYFTQGMMHASSLASECLEDEARTIVCVGGDGTFNEIVNGILQHKRAGLPELALIPVGTGSDFARTINMSRDIDEAVSVLLHGASRLCDVGKVTFRDQNHQWVRYFINVFDMGLGGKVVRIANRIPKNLGGFLTFFISSLGALVTFRRMRVRIEVDGIPVDEGVMWIVGAANGQFFGGGMHMAPMARITDGVFECLYVKDTSIFKFLVHVLGKVYDGQHLQYKNVHHTSGKCIRITSAHSCLSEIDGEEEKAREVVVSVIPKSLKIRVPSQPAK